MSTAAEQNDRASPPGAPDDAQRRFTLLQDTRELVITRLSKVIGEALTRMSDELAALAVRSRSADEQHALMDAVTVVRQHRTEIELRFRRSFSEVFERRLFNPAAGLDASSDAPAELSLVDDSVIQAKLAADRLIHRMRGKLDPDEVLGIRARLAALIERDWFEEDAHPASPEAVFEALRASLAEVAPKAEVQAALLNAFEPHVTANLNQVYASVNDTLKANRVLPKIRPQVVVKAGAKRPPGAGPATDAALGAAPAGAAAGRMTGAQPGPAGGMDVGAATSLSPAAHQVQAVLAELSSGAPTARASATRMLADPDLFALADLPIPAVEPPLLEALTTLQTNSAANVVGVADLRADLHDHAREKGSPLDQLTVEIVSMVFDYIYADKRLADVVKQQLLRLQVVAIKAALIDRSFFARRQHPMRRLIDRISEIAADPDAGLEADAPLVKGIEAVVEWVLLNFDQDLAAFDEARERIDALAADEAVRRAERIAKLTREAERAEAVAHARLIARARIADRLDADTPEFARQFLDEWWSPVMAEAQVDGLAAAIGFDEAVSIAEGLIWSVAPKAPEEVPKLAALLPKLINGLMRGARMAAMPDERRQAFFNDLLEGHTRAIEAAKQTAAAAASRKPSNLRMRPDGKIQFAPIVPTAAAAPAEPPPAEARSMRLADLRRGDAVELDTGGGEWRTFKLAWISPAQRLYVLSRFPDEARSLDRAQLAALFDGGRARMAEKASSLERAIESIATDATPADGAPAPSRRTESELAAA